MMYSLFPMIRARLDEHNVYGSSKEEKVQNV